MSEYQQKYIEQRYTNIIKRLDAAFASAKEANRMVANGCKGSKEALNLINGHLTKHDLAAIRSAGYESDGKTRIRNKEGRLLLINMEDNRGGDEHYPEGIKPADAYEAAQKKREKDKQKKKQ